MTRTSDIRQGQMERLWICLKDFTKVQINQDRNIRYNTGITEV